MKHLLLILYTFTFLVSTAQNREWRFGGSIGFNIAERTQFSAKEYTPENAFYTYLAEEDENGKKDLINQDNILNAFSIGSITSFSVKKFTFNMELAYRIHRRDFQFTKPYNSSRVVGSRSLRIPLFINYRFFRKANSLFFTTGFILNFSKHYDYQNPGMSFTHSDGAIYDGGIDYGDNHFIGVLYNSGSYTDVFLGLGKNIKNIDFTFRFATRTPKSQEKILGWSRRLELNLSYFFLNTTDFAKKRKVYNE